jgi:hypothetical protein
MLAQTNVCTHAPLLWYMSISTCYLCALQRPKRRGVSSMFPVTGFSYVLVENFLAAAVLGVLDTFCWTLHSFNLKKVRIVTKHEKLQTVSKHIANSWTLLRKWNLYQRYIYSFLTNLWNILLQVLQTLVPISFLRQLVANTQVFSFKRTANVKV